MARPYLWLVLIGISFATQTASGERAIVATIGQSGESIELEWQEEGRTVSSSLPLYSKGAVHYFSAGVGVEERSAQYPPFALKVVFTAGDKSLLSHAGVTIQPAKAGVAIIIPPEQVEGPWLFVDLTPGLYDLSATFSGRVQQLKGVKIEPGRQKVVHFRWKEPRDSPVRIAEDSQADSDKGPLGKEGQ